MGVVAVADGMVFSRRSYRTKWSRRRKRAPPPRRARRRRRRRCPRVYVPCRPAKKRVTSRPTHARAATPPRVGGVADAGLAVMDAVEGVVQPNGVCLASRRCWSGGSVGIRFSRPYPNLWRCNRFPTPVWQATCSHRRFPTYVAVHAAQMTHMVCIAW